MVGKVSDNPKTLAKKFGALSDQKMRRAGANSLRGRFEHTTTVGASYSS